MCSTSGFYHCNRKPAGDLAADGCCSAREGIHTAASHSLWDLTACLSAWLRASSAWHVGTAPSEGVDVDGDGVVKCSRVLRVLKYELDDLLPVRFRLRLRNEVMGYHAN